MHLRGAVFLVTRRGKEFHARRNDDSRRRAVIDDCIIGWLSIIGTVGSKLSDRTVNLVEQWRNLGDIAGVLISLGMRSDLATIGIQRQMQLAPTATGSGAMLFLQPLARAPGPASRRSRSPDRMIGAYPTP